MLRAITAIRYVEPLREGGSLPAIVEADDDGTYVLKFRGAGQGRKALIAELVAGEIGRALGLPVPEMAIIELDPELGRLEPDPEIRDLIFASAGLNLAVDYLPGALGFDALDVRRVAPELASAIVWFDAFVTNVDRTARNPNMLFWHKQLWLIDHGASLYFHHTWDDYLARSRTPFAAIRQHVLLPAASAIGEADAALANRITAELLHGILAAVPAVWLEGEPAFGSVEEHREAYVVYLLNRLRPPRAFVEEAIHARAELV